MHGIFMPEELFTCVNSMTACVNQTFMAVTKYPTENKRKEVFSWLSVPEVLAFPAREGLVEMGSSRHGRPGSRERCLIPLGSSRAG